MASIGIGFLGEPALADLLEPVFGGLSHGVAVGISVAIAFTLVTAIHITFGEQVPKMLAITRAESDGAATAGPLGAFRVAQRAVHARADQGRERDRAAVRGRPGSSRSSTPQEDVKAIISPVGTRAGRSTRARR